MAGVSAKTSLQCLLIFNVPNKAHLRKLENLDEETQPLTKRLVYTRRNFLSFCVAAVQSKGNQDVYMRLQQAHHNRLSEEEKKDADFEVEKWEDWMYYPKFEEADITSQDASLLMAWLVRTFGPCVCYSKIKESQREVDYTSVFQWMTADDLAFAFLQVEQNIDRWLLHYNAHKEQRIPAWKEVEFLEECDCDAKSLKKKDSESLRLVQLMSNRGCEFPPGAGVNGSQGRKRYNSVKRYFDDCYFRDPNSEIVTANRNALIKALQELDAEDPKEPKVVKRAVASPGTEEGVMAVPDMNALSQMEDRWWTSVIEAV